jgi:hypothetical protein
MPVPTPPSAALPDTTQDPTPVPGAHAARAARTGRAAAHALVQVALLGSSFAVYKWVRYLARDRYDAALANAQRVRHLEQLVHLDVELEVQRWVLQSTELVRFLNRYYASVHFPAFVVFLCWLYLRDRDGYRHVRFVLVVGSGAALLLHVLVPLAPPRMLPGFVDTTAVFGPNPYGSDAARQTSNQIAAMPSLHFMWAALAAYGVVRFGRSPVRWAVLAHPATTLVAIVATANHYVVDSVVAAVLMVAAIGVAPTGRSRRTDADPWCPLVRLEPAVVRGARPVPLPVPVRSRETAA